MTQQTDTTMADNTKAAEEALTEAVRAGRACQFNRKICSSGQYFRVWVLSDGSFAAIHQGERIECDSPEALQTKLNNLLKKQRVKMAIRFAAITRDYQLLTGTIVGMHASRDGIWLVRYADGNAAQLGLYEFGTFLQDGGVDHPKVRRLVEIGAEMRRLKTEREEVLRFIQGPDKDSPADRSFQERLKQHADGLLNAAEV